MPHGIRFYIRASLMLLVLALAAGCAQAQPGQGAGVAAEPAEVRVEVVGPLEVLAAQSARVGGRVLAVSPGAQVEAGLHNRQVVRVEGVLGAEGLSAHSIAAASGQPAGQTFELTGPLESLADGVWVIAGRAVLVTSQTEVKGSPGVGALVKAQGSLSAGGGLVAREVRRVDGPQVSAAVPGDEIEFAGVVTSIGPDAWVIGGRSVQVTLQTEIKPGLDLGLLAKVHAQPQADGSLWAREIEPANRPVVTRTPGTPGAAHTPPAPSATRTPGAPAPEFEFRGLLTAIAGDVWTVGGRQVRVTAATEVKGILQIGDNLKVHAQPQADGSLWAREIELSDRPAATQVPGAPAPELEFRGVLTAISGDVWTVGGRQVRVTAATEVKGILQIGDNLKVHAQPQADGSLWAREVERSDRNDDDRDDNSGRRGGGDNDDDDDDRDDDDNSGRRGGDDDDDDDDDRRGSNSGRG
jgi:hypothetical protein